MDVANPVPGIAVLLVLLLPAVWLAGRTVAWLVIDDRWSARLAAPGMAIALWILTLHITGLLSGSFQFALWAGTLVVAAGGIVGLAVEYRGRIVPPPISWRPSRWMWPGAALAVIVIAPITFGWAFHDELFYTGHMSMTAAIQNGGYPPTNLSLPTYDLRYHYGFALLNAALGGILRVRIDTGMDLISLAAWGYLFILFWAMGDRLLEGGRGWITALVALFGGGFPYLCAATAATTALTLLGVCSTGGTFMNPPFISYFFQHPWAVGMPIALVLLATFFSHGPARIRFPVMALLLVALSICQFVLFAALAAVLIVADTWNHGSVSLRRGIAMAATSLLAVAAASRLGGFFAAAPTDFFSALVYHAGVADGVIPVIRWHLVTLGLLLPLGAVGLILMRSGRLLTFCLVAGSLVIVNAVRYPYSWDIIKFGVIASVGLSVAASVAISHILDIRRPVLAALAGGTGLMGTLTAGFLFVGVITVDAPGIPEYPFGRSPVSVSADDAAAIGWLRMHVAPGQIVYRARPESLAYAQWGGLPQVWTDNMAARLGMPAIVREERERLFVELPSEPEPYLEDNVVWFVLSPADSRLTTVLQPLQNRGRAILRATFGDLRVVELVTPSGSDGRRPDLDDPADFRDDGSA